MVTTTFVASTGGPKLQVQDFIKTPTLVQTLVAKMLDQAFLADGLLRDAGGTDSGSYVVRIGETLYANGLEVIEEYGEIPVAEFTDGTPTAVFTVKGGGAFILSREMQQRNSIDVVNRRLRQIKNGMVKFWDQRMWTAINAAGIPTQAASSTAWTDPTSKIRYDIGKGSSTVQQATDVDGNIIGFQPDTLVVHTSRVSAWTYNDDIAKVYIQSPLASENPQYTGATGKDIMGLQLWSTPWIDPTKALLCERKTLGFIGNEVPLETTPLYEQRERQSYRSDTTRRSAIGIDQPKAALYITGV